MSGVSTWCFISIVGDGVRERERGGGVIGKDGRRLDTYIKFSVSSLHPPTSAAAR